MADPNRQRLGRLSKNKGRVFERLIVNKFKDAGIHTERGWWQAHSGPGLPGGARVPDVILEGFWLELGHGKTMDPVVKLRQAEEYVKLKTWPDKRPVPVSITRRDGREITVCMRLEDLVRLSCNAQAVMTKSLPVYMDWESFIDILKGLGGYVNELLVKKEAQTSMFSSGSSSEFDFDK